MAMPPGQRITLTKRIGEALMHDSMANIDLALDTFEVPQAQRPSEFWPGDLYEYVLRRLTKASGPAIVELHAHLYPDAPAPSSESDGPAAIGNWEEDEFRLFLSHTHAHRVLAGQVRETMKLYGIDTFVAHDMIEPTKKWQEEIETALGTCDALAALLTTDFVESKWCDQEVGTALGRGRCIVGIKQGTNPHGFIGKYQAVDGDTSPWAAEEITKGVVRALWVNTQTRPLMGRSAAVAFAESISFDNARENYERLKEVQADEWTDEMLTLVQLACSENRQVEEAVSKEPLAYGKPIPDLLSKHLDALLNRDASTGEPEFQSASTTASADDDIPF